MEWVGVLLASFVVLLLLGPPLLFAGTFFALVGLGHVLGASETVSASTFRCPFSRRRVTAEFLSVPGARHPVDVRSCSAFRDPHRIRCRKGCLRLAITRWAPPPTVPRYALIAGGVTYREPNPEALLPVPEPHQVAGAA